MPIFYISIRSHARTHTNPTFEEDDSCQIKHSEVGKYQNSGCPCNLKLAPFCVFVMMPSLITGSRTSFSKGPLAIFHAQDRWCSVKEQLFNIMFSPHCATCIPGLIYCRVFKPLLLLIYTRVFLGCLSL